MKSSILLPSVMESAYEWSESVPITAICCLFAFKQYFTCCYVVSALFDHDRQLIKSLDSGEVLFNAARTSRRPLSEHLRSRVRNRERRRWGGQNGLIGRTSMLNDDGLAAYGF